MDLNITFSAKTIILFLLLRHFGRPSQNLMLNVDLFYVEFAATPAWREGEKPWKLLSVTSTSGESLEK